MPGKNSSQGSVSATASTFRIPRTLLYRVKQLKGWFQDFIHKLDFYSQLNGCKTLPWYLTLTFLGYVCQLVWTFSLIGTQRNHYLFITLHMESGPGNPCRHPFSNLLLYNTFLHQSQSQQGWVKWSVFRILCDMEWSGEKDRCWGLRGMCYEVTSSTTWCSNILNISEHLTWRISEA